MKKIYISIIAVLSVCQFTYAQWSTNIPTNTITSTTNSVGIGTTNPQAPLDVATLLNPGTLSAVLGHLPEGNSQGGGTYLGIKVYNTQLSGNITNATNVVSFAIEHSFYGVTNSSINFFRGGNTSGGSISFNTNNNSEVMRLLYNGNVGIGTTAPGSVLSIINSTPVIQLFDKESNPGDGSSEGKLAFGSINGEFASVEASRLIGSADDLTTLKFRTSFAVGAGGDGDNIERMRINYNGNVGIGTITPDQKLTVKGTVHSQAVIVDNNVIPDYVFKPDYKLVLLKDVKAYIDKNHHLSEIPSAKTVARHGLNLGAMNTLLLKKVEELTLYTIAADKKANNEAVVVVQQQTQLTAQQKQIDRLNEQVQALINSSKK
jgi:hypothetical protein